MRNSGIRRHSSASCNTKDARKMALLDDYLTEEQLAGELKNKTGRGTKRTLRLWRARRKGPPWANLGKIIVYPTADFRAWLRAQVQQPVRSRRAA
jgi:hypothetical protein